MQDVDMIHCFFGILKPVGLPDPKTGKDPYAVLQLRKDNAQGSLYNLVGCQTHLKWGRAKAYFLYDSST